MNAAVPSLAPERPAPAPAGALTRPARLVDLMAEGFTLIFLLRSGQSSTDADAFREAVLRFLQDFERQAQRSGASAEDVHLSKYAFCALLDEVVLQGHGPLAAVWQLRPLQLECFGDQLAGDQFFQHLENLRREGARRLPSLEVYQMCLLLGFQGMYVLEGREKLAFLIARLGDEIQLHQGGRRELAPFWRAPDRIIHVLRTEIPVWAVASGFALLALLAFIGLRTGLRHQTEQDLAPYQQLVQLPPRQAHVTIQLP